MDAETRRLLAQAKVEEVQSKGAMDPVKQQEARAKIMDAETRRMSAEMQAQKMGVESDHREADRMVDAHHRREDRKMREDEVIAKILQDLTRNRNTPNV